MVYTKNMDEMTTAESTSTAAPTSNHVSLISAHLAKLKKTTDSIPESALELFGFLPKKKKKNKEEK